MSVPSHLGVPLPDYGLAHLTCKRCGKRFWGFGFRWMQVPSSRWARYAYHFLHCHDRQRDPHAWEMPA